MSFAVAGAVVGGDALAAGMSDAVLAGIADSAATGAIADGVLATGETVAGTAAAGGAMDMGVGLTDAGMPATDSTLASGSTGATEVSGAGPAAQTGEATQSGTDKLIQQIQGAPPSPGQADQALATDQAASADPAKIDQGLPDNTSTPATPEKGIISKAVDWAGAHPTAAVMAGQTIAGAVGGVGKAALEKQIQERNIQAQQALLSQRTAETLALSRGGALQHPNIVRPSGQVPIKRPDGSIVYVPKTGIVSTQIPPA